MARTKISTRLDHWKARARRLKRDVYALYLAYKDRARPGTRGVVVAYAFSPLDLIPDFIPVLGYLDDLVLVPLGIALAIRLIPPHVLAESRAEAAQAMAARKPVNRIAAAIIVATWLLLAIGTAILLYRLAR